MRVLIHSNAPWVPSGYGVQCAHLCTVLKALGHEVGVSAISGLGGAHQVYDDVAVFPSGRIDFGLDTLVEHADLFRADLVITLMDFYRLYPIAPALKKLNLAAWLPIDTDELGVPDRETLKHSGARPIAMSQHGERALAAAGWDNALYAPHMHDVDQETYDLSVENRERYRAGWDLTGKFVVGIAAANNDHLRKGFPEQFEAFRRFAREHDDAVLLVHSLPQGMVNLEQLATDLEIAGKIRFSDPYAQVTGALDASLMRDWFSVLDVLSNCSFGEGFGVPLLEAQAMGTPGIATRCSAMQDPERAEWKVEGEPMWNFVHQRWWTKPHVIGIHRALNKAYKWASTRRETSRAAAAPYYLGEQLPVWEKILEQLAPAVTDGA